MLDALVNWMLDLVDVALDAWPTWTLTLPDLSGLAHPLSQVNWLIDLSLPWGIALAMLAIGPALLFVTLSLWVVGLFTPSSTTR
jgi:hypothetical protein